jgi:hypothetical protein
VSGRYLIFDLRGGRELTPLSSFQAFHHVGFHCFCLRLMAHLGDGSGAAETGNEMSSINMHFLSS